jgi:hypothetical protein
LGVSGRASLGPANFDWEAFPYARIGPGGVGTFYASPLWGGWRVDGFWNLYRGGASVGKVYLHRALSARVNLMLEYFHQGFIKGADQDRVSVGISYRLY